MPIIDQVANALQDVFGSVAQDLARATRFVQCASKLGGAHFVQTLVIPYLANPSATLAELSQTAEALSVAIPPPLFPARCYARHDMICRQREGAP